MRIGQEATARLTTLVVAGLLIASGLTDLAVSADFSFARGAHATAIVAVAETVMLAVLAYAAGVAETAYPGPEAMRRDAPAGETSCTGVPDRAVASATADAAIIATLDAVMRERRLYRDPDLTLNRLARRIGVPARQVSGAVNRTYGRSISQVVNEHRVAEARRLLAETDLSITDIMLAVGFQTKSNFNREFKRLAGEAPSAFRRATPGRPSRADLTGLKPGARAPGNG